MSERSSSFGPVHAIVMLACFANAGFARAQHGREWSSAIQVHGGSSCVSAASLRGRIARYLAADEPPPELAVEVDLAADPPSFRVRQAGSSIAERRFDRLPSGCAERRDAVALTIAVAIEHALPPEREVSPVPAASGSGASQPSAAGARPRASQPAAANARTAAPQPAAAVEPQPQPQPQPQPHPQPQPESSAPQLSSSYADNIPSSPSEPWVRPTERWMVHAGVTYLVQAVATPTPAFTLGGEFAVFPALRLGLSGLASPGATFDFSPGRVESQLFGGQAYACLNAPFFAVIVHGCAGAVAAYVRAEGYGYNESLDAEMAWLAGVLRLVVEVPATGAVAVRLLGAGHMNAFRPEVYFEQLDGTEASKPVTAFGASLGAELLVRIE